jgi:hypothetical protein
MRGAPDSVCFYLPEREGLRGIDTDGIDPDADWRLFGTAVYVWILQTFVRLRRAGAPVQLALAPPERGVVVAHAIHVDRLLREAPNPSDIIVVSTRSDKPKHLLADFEIVQNGSNVGDYQFFIPSWIQPGLVARSADRGTRVECVAYYGARGQLHEDLTTPEWAEALRNRGVRWEANIVTFAGHDRQYADLRWNDYSSTDIVVALRPRRAWNRRSKPAAKLQNAWAAGVPAILSPELQYQELRRSPQDYLEVRDGKEALLAIDALRADSARYTEMVRNGRVRAEDFRHERLAARWIEVLWTEIPARSSALGQRLLRRARSRRALARTLKERWTSTARTTEGAARADAAGNQRNKGSFAELK